jgi:hypothetical protein
VGRRLEPSHFPVARGKDYPDVATDDVAHPSPINALRAHLQLRDARRKVMLEATGTQQSVRYLADEEKISLRNILNLGGETRGS